MFLRFVSWEVHREARVYAGIFCAAYRLRRARRLSRYEREALADLLGWFEENLEIPERFAMPAGKRWKHGVCWFKHAAGEHLARAHQMVTILEDNGVYIRLFKARRVGTVIYEDKIQVVAVPSYDLNHQR